MLSLSELRDAASLIGLPAVVIVSVLVAFHTGMLPSATSRAYDGVVSLSMDHGSHQETLKSVLRQHDEQMDVLMQGMREICFNTAVNKERERACANLQHYPSVKP